MQEDKIIFALDIGTRSVIGVVGAVRDQMLEILEVETVEHTERAMIDGQIEDIDQAAKVAGLVKTRLEERLGFALHEVHVAAAGRVLKTRRAQYEAELDDRRPIDRRQMSAFEAGAVQRAYEELIAEMGEDQMGYCCVGHSVVQYMLDGYAFSTLAGHRGRKASVDLIATFLPSEVVESLYMTMSRIGLTVASMTLEPIAAMNAVIPKELRLLNVALVDVGAGTSDIAIADSGGVCGYTMATIAGDEITERIMRELLVDFEAAERLKRQLGEEKVELAYTDILGLEYTVPRAELLERIGPSVDQLALEISDRILEINGKPPMAVFLVGGGSGTAGLCAKVAKQLGIDEKKAAVGGSNYMKRTVKAPAQYLCADYATPIGIAVTAMSADGTALSVILNGEQIRLPGGSATTVIEALLRGGYQYSQIMGRSGKSLQYELDGESRLARGEPPVLAEISVNGNLAGITAPLLPGDEICFVPAASGTDAVPRIRDARPDFDSFTVELLGEEKQAGVWIERAGEPADADALIERGDRLTSRRIETVGELLASEELPEETAELRQNGRPTEPQSKLHPGDVIDLAQETVPVRPAVGRPVPVGVQAVSGPKPIPAREIRISLNGRTRSLTLKADGMPYQFFDLFNFVDIDPANPQGELILRRNERTANFLDPVHDGDRIEIGWAEETGF